MEVRSALRQLKAHFQMLWRSFVDSRLKLGSRMMDDDESD